MRVLTKPVVGRVLWLSVMDSQSLLCRRLISPRECGGHLLPGTGGLLPSIEVSSNDEIKLADIRAASVLGPSAFDPFSACGKGPHSKALVPRLCWYLYGSGQQGHLLFPLRPSHCANDYAGTGRRNHQSLVPGS